MRNNPLSANLPAIPCALPPPKLSRMAMSTAFIYPTTDQPLMLLLLALLS